MFIVTYTIYVYRLDKNKTVGYIPFGIVVTQFLSSIYCAGHYTFLWLIGLYFLFRHPSLPQTTHVSSVNGFIVLSTDPLSSGSAIDPLPSFANNPTIHFCKLK